MKKDPIYKLKKLKAKYLLLRSVETLVLALASACLVFATISLLNISLGIRLIIAAAIGAMVLTILVVRLKLYGFDKNRLIVFINHRYPVMQHSTDLLFKGAGTLTSLEQIQKEKVRPHFEQIVSAIRLPHQIERAFVVLGMSIVFTTILFFFSSQLKRNMLKKNEGVLAETGFSTTLPASVKELAVKVTPPAYTGVKVYTTEDLNLSIPEGSRVSWNIIFSDTVADAGLVFLQGDSLQLSPFQQQYRAERVFSESNIYQLSWRPPTGEARISDYYKAEVIRDQPPRIVVPQQPEYTEIRVGEIQNVPLKVHFSDDYGLKDAYIIATVSKGSGESIKFREEKLSFKSPSEISGRDAQVSRMIDLKTLGLEPGDELYFYVEALDNKRPLANRARTPTYFISLQDTSSQMLSVEAGLGIDLMPAYFRSQRQIIIDSEKLLRERKAIGQQEFNTRSNEIGYDQKVLRLKYGEFLGEEFETNIGPGAEPSEGEEGHHHKEGEETDPTEAYKHVHDDPEEATFFTQSIRSKLKAALSAMWEAELHLRTFDPKKSLPYQYRALRLLKDISQDSRTYVHKTGFDPPPLKEEKRLTGNLSEIKNSAHNRHVDKTETFSDVRSALDLTEQWLANRDRSFTPLDKQILLYAGRELAPLALQEPGNYLHALSIIRSINDNELSGEDLWANLLFLRKIFWNVLPEEMATPDKTAEGIHHLDREFINNLRSLTND